MVTGELVYVGSCSGRFVAFSRRSGEEVWSHDTAADGESGTFHGDALVADGTVVVGADGRAEWLYAFDSATGAVRWKQQFARGVSRQVLGREGVAYAVGGAGDVTAVDTGTGRVIWTVAETTVPANDWPRDDPALADGLLLVSWPDGHVAALDARTGERRWTTRLQRGLNTSIAVAAESAWIGDMSGHLFRLDLRTGKVEATIDAGGMLYGDLQVAGDCLLALSSETGHSLTCRDSRSGVERWRWRAAKEISTFRPLVVGDQVVLGTSGTLVSLRLDNGEQAWECPIGGVPRGISAAADQLYVGMLDGALRAMPMAACRGDHPAVATP
ncbi:MAG TPA: PQQ-binding-like beta-propeller repeat protein [Thermoanaerobaculia bacterium]|nr:PQQ-binding-like beta-propeller repeat protein [Thermoanaerobaculia bacterium]